MKSYKYIGMAMLTAVTLSGCSDFLDTENKSNANQNGEEFFKKNAESLLTSAYYSYRDIVNMIDIADQLSLIHI